MKNHDPNKKIQQNMCWWCGAPANSAEHKYKKSDLIASYGKGPYKNENGLIWVSPDGKKLALRGPKSKMAKFEPNLCDKCNNNRSQPFDLAYEKFANYIRADKKNIYRTREIDFEKAFGKDWHPETLNFYKYLVKHVMCRVSDLLPVVPDVIRFLNGQSDLFSLLFKFKVPFDVDEIIDLDPSELPIAVSETALYVNSGKIFGYYELGWFRFCWLYLYKGRNKYPFIINKKEFVEVDRQTPHSLSV